MAHLTVRVPEQHADALRAALLGAHDRCTDQLAAAVARYRAGRRDIDAVEGALVEVRDLHDALEQLGWEPGAGTGDALLHVAPEALDEAIARLPGAAEAGGLPPLWLWQQLPGADDQDQPRR